MSIQKLQGTQRNCEGMTRRNCIHLGLGTLLGGGLATTLQARAQGAITAAITSKDSRRQAESCILLWLDGGPTHYETFDPKDDAPSEIRGELRSIPTRTPGMRFSQLMTELADISDKLTIVRSICHNQNNHGAGNHYMLTGAPTRIPVSCGAAVSFHPSMGAVTASERGAPAGLPGYFSLGGLTRSGGPNFLGAKFAPFLVAEDPAKPEFRVRDVALPRELTGEKFLGRNDLRSKIDSFVRITDESAGDPAMASDEYYRQGLELVTSKEAQAAFDIHAEPQNVRDEYGMNHLGQRLLLARRLTEAGVPFVTITDGSWDHHTKIFPAMHRELPMVDRGVAALIRDLDRRGRLDSTLILVLGEFGRTPTINKDGGRDHWSNAMSVLVAGGGTPGGQIVGATDVRGYAASERILSPENFSSTVYQKLGIDPGKILFTPEGRPVHLVSDPTPIPELMG
jgi:hypothetical protein